MSKHWTTVRMGKVLRRRKEFIIIDDLALYKRARVQLHAQGIVLRDEIPGAQIKTKRQQVCRAGEFLVAEIHANIGGLGIVPASLNGSIVSSHYFLFVINETKLDRRFLDYYVRTPSFLEQVEAQGSTRNAAIRPSQVLNYEIPLPSLSEQRRVVARIDELANQIYEARNLNQAATKETDAFIMALGNSRTDAMKRYERWRLKDLINKITKGESPEWQGYAYQDTGPLFIRSENVLWGNLDASHATHIPEAFHEKVSRTKLRGGDVLINLVGASIGRCCYVRDDLGPANVNQAVAVISPKNERLLSEFLVHYLLTPGAQDEIHGNEVDTARPNISLGDLQDMMIPVPPISDQRRIVAELDALKTEVDALKSLQTETTTELDALLPTILDRVFKGELYAPRTRRRTCLICT